MGGIVGLAAAATLLRERISALDLNDITPAAPDIEGYDGSQTTWQSARVREVAEFARPILRTVYAPAGVRSDEAWRAMAEASLRRLPNGRFTSHYDPAIARAFAAVERSAISGMPTTGSIPSFLLRGERSDVATAESARQMTQRGPRWPASRTPGRRPRTVARYARRDRPRAGLFSGPDVNNPVRDIQREDAILPERNSRCCSRRSSRRTAPQG